MGRLLAIIASLILLVLLFLVILLNVPQVQNFAKNLGVNYLNKKIGTAVHLETLSIDFPRSITLDSLYVEDQSRDTLVFSKHLFVKLDMWGLLSGNFYVDSIRLDDFSAKVHRRLPDTTFNYQYILDAFGVGEEEEKEESTSSADLFVENISLSNIRLSYDDTLSGYNAKLGIGDFNTHFDTLNLDKMRFVLDSVFLDKTRATFVRSSPLRKEKPAAVELESSPDETANELPYFFVAGLSLKQIQLHYLDRVEKMEGIIDLDSLLLVPKKIDLNRNEIQLEKFVMDRSLLSFSMTSKPTPPSTPQSQVASEKPESETTNEPSLLITLDSLQLLNNHLKFDDFGEPRQEKGIDYNHIDVTNLKLLASNLRYTEDSSHVFLKNLSLKEHSGFQLDTLTTDAIYTNHGASLSKLLVLTPHSRIDRNLSITYPSLSAFSKTPGEMGMDIDIDSAIIDLQDVYYFQPDLATNEYLSGLSQNPLYLTGIVKGKLKDFLIDTLSLKMADQTYLNLKGQLTNVLNPEQSFYKIRLNELQTGRKDLLQLLPKDLLPSDVEIPTSLALKGDYSGSLNTFQTQMDLKSSDGNAKIDVGVNRISDSIRATYKAAVQIHRLRLDRILKNDTLYGPLSMTAHVKGKGLTAHSAQATLKGKVLQAVYNKYNYRNLILSGAVDHGTGQLQAKMDDPNANFTLISKADFEDSIPSGKLNFDIRNLDLYQLHLVDDRLSLQGKIDADFDQLDIDHLDGKLALEKWNIVHDDRKIFIDSVVLKADHQNRQNRVELQSPLATAEITGDYKLSEMGALMQRLNEKYFGNDSLRKEPQDTLSAWKMDLNIKLLTSKLWKEFLPDLTRFNGGEINGRISSKPDSLTLQADIPSFQYLDYAVDSTSLHIVPRNNKVTYALNVDNVHDSSTIDIPHLLLNGDVDESRIYVNLQTKDNQKKDRFRIAGNLKVRDSSFHYSLIKDSLLLNYESWDVPEDNYIDYSPNGLTIQQLKLQRGQQYLSANTDTSSEGRPLTVAFQKFNINTLTPLFLSDSLQIGGEINGDAEIKNMLTNPLIHADMSLDSLSFEGADIGTLALKANNEEKDAYALNARLSGNDNDITIDGKYNTDEEGSFDFDIVMNALSMTTIQAFSFGQLQDAEGKLTGNLKLTGTTEQPQIDGALYFKNAEFLVSELNEKLKLKNEGITFNPDGIHFDQFTIRNSDDNKAVIDGNILTEKYEHFDFDLSLSANKFQVFNTKKAKDKSYYGKLFLSTKTSITGDNNLPNIDMSVRLDKGTNFTYVLVDKDPEAVSSEGIVKFFDPNVVDTVFEVSLDSSRYNNALKGIDLSADIVIDTNAVFNLIIDPVSGDNLYVRGKADLNFSMNPGGEMSLTGRYDLLDGQYNLSFEGLVKKKFNLLRGSYINWEGDPMKAKMGITAEYDLKTSPADLIQDQLSDENESSNEAYKQKLPFEVLLHLNGELMHPEINFELDMPEDAQQALDGAVYTRIKQINEDPSEVNKQTLGLLVFNRFIGENPLKTSAGGSGDMVRESANKILTQQLNKLAGNLIQGVDLDLALESSKDYSSGEAENQTNLNVGISKNLFNDRTKVYVGGDIPLEGNNNRESSQIVGDVAVEYKISKDGRYRVRAYRKNKYQGVIEGEFVETGLSFIIMMNYNKFKELFKSTKALEEESEK